MKKLIQHPGPLGVLLFGLLCCNSGAHDVLPPCWRGVDGSTSQRWEFNSDANPVAPDVSANPYGTASASMTVGSPGLGWRTNVLGYGLQTNYWGLGSGSMTLTVPNRPGTPPASWKLVSLQVAQFVEDSIFKDADATLPGATLLDVTNVTVEVVPPAPGRWQVRRFLWRVEPNPVSETITITRGSGLDLFVDAVVVDTLCITNANTYVDAAYAAADCALVSWPEGGAPADKPLGILAYVDLQTGVDRAPTNGTVNVAAGDYDGPISIAKPVTLKPGPATASVGIAGSFTLGSAVTLAMDLNGLVPGSGHDQLGVFGPVNLGGATLQLACNTTLNIGDSVTILEKLNSGAIVGTFGNWPAGTTNLVGGQQFKISYTGGSGNDVVLTMVNHAPIPAAKVAQTDENQSATMTAVKFLSGATDPDIGDVISFAGVLPTSTQGGTVVSNASGVTYTPPLNYHGPDEFYFLLTDGRAVSVGTVSVTVRPAGAGTFNMLPLTFDVDNHPVVRFAGILGHTYDVQRSVDSASGPWTTIATIALPLLGSGIGEHVDDEELVPEPSSRFYRTRHVSGP